MIDFIEQIAERTGLPVGIKSAIGDLHFWEELADRMIARNQGPDFITVDGSEGGTGAAPLSFSTMFLCHLRSAFLAYIKFFQKRISSIESYGLDPVIGFS